MAITPETEAERRLLAGSTTGETVMVSDLAPAERIIRADLLRTVWLDPAAQGKELSVSGAHVNGPLNLECATLRPARLEGATFNDEFILRSAKLTRLELSDCRLTILRALGAEFSQSLTMVRSRVTVGIGLDSVSVTGIVKLQGLEIGTDPAVTCLTIRNASIEDLFLIDGFKAVGRVDLRGTKVAGELGISDADLLCSDGWALNLRGLEADTFRMLDSRCKGEIDMSGSIVKTFIGLRGSFENEEGDVLSLNDIKAGMVMLDGSVGDGFVGEIRVVGSEISTVTFSGRFYRPEGSPIGVAGSRIRDVFISDAQVSGQLWIRNCEIEGLLRVKGTRVAGPPLAASVLSSAFGMIEILDSSVLGGLSFVDTSVRASFMCERTALSNLGSVALHFGLSTVRGLFSIHDVDFAGAVNLKESSLHILSDDVGSGPSQLGSWGSAQALLLTGLTFSFGEGTNQKPSLRHTWLTHTMDHEPSSWKHLAETYRLSGLEESAVRTLIAKEDDRLKRAELSLRRKAWLMLLRGTIGYGYRSWLAGIWSIVVIGIFATVASANRGDFVGDGRSSLQPIAYATDTFLPIIDLDQAAHWMATGWVAWVEWAVIIAGWILSTLFVAGFTRLIRN